MRKKDRRNLIIGLVVVIGIILLAVFLSQPLSTSGFSTLSLTDANLESNAPSGSPFSGKAWVLTVRLGGLGQSAFGTFSPSDVEDQTDDGSKTTKDFSISVTQQNQQCNYDIVNRGELPIRKLNYQRWIYNLFNCNYNDATSRGISQSSIIWLGKPSGSIYCYAVYKTEESSVRSYENPDIRVQAKVDIDAGSRSGSFNLDTEDNTRSAISDFAYVEWQGSLDTGKSCPSSSGYVPVYRNGQWINVYSSSYDSYKNEYDKGIKTDFVFPGDDIIGFVNDVNSKANSALISRSFGSFESRTSLSKGRLINELSSPIQNPVLTFYIKSETLGIYTPTPNIKLLSAKSDCFSTGSEGFIEVMARNDGEEATIEFYTQCDNSFTTGASNEYGFKKGEEKRIILPLTASASSKVTGSCVIYAEHPLMGKKKISTSVCVDPLKTCTPNKLFCGVLGGNSVVKQCSSDGVTSSVKEICEVGKVCEEKGSGAKCTKGTGGGGFFGGLWDGIKNFFSDLFGGVFDFLTIIKYILIAVGTIVAFMGSTGLLQYLGDRFRFKPFRNYPWLVYLIASGISLAVAYLLYVFIGSFWFWIMVIAIVIYNFFFSQLNVFNNLRKAGKRAIRRR